VSPPEVCPRAGCFQTLDPNGMNGFGGIAILSLRARQKRSIDTTALLLLSEAGEMTCNFNARLQFVAKFKGKIYEFKSFVSCNVPETTSIGVNAQWGINGENSVNRSGVIWGDELRLMFAVTWDCECLLKECASRQEKPPSCHQNCASTYAHIRDLTFSGSRNVNSGINLEACTQEKIAGPADFNSLAEMDSRVRSDCAMAYEVADGAAGGRTGGWIFASVELHSRPPGGLSGVCRPGGAKHVEPAR